MFNEKNERKENTVQFNHWTTRPQFLRLFDDYDQYLDFLSVWYGNWSSRDPGHMERTDFSGEDCFDVDDDMESVGVSDASDDVEWFLIKDRSRALRRRSDALHKLHVKDVSQILSRKANRKSDSEKTRSSSSAKAYKRATILQPQCVTLTTWKEVLGTLSKARRHEDLRAITACGIDGKVVDVNGLRLFERKAGEDHDSGVQAVSYKKRADLYSCKTNHEKERIKVAKKVEMKAAEEAAKKAAKDAVPGDKPGKSKSLIIIKDGEVTPKVNVVSANECYGTNSSKEHFAGQRAIGRKNNTSISPVRMQETRMPVVMAKPEQFMLFIPRVSAAGFPFHG